MTNDMLDQKPSATRRVPLVIATVAIGGLAGFAALYGLGLGRSPSGDSTCRPAVATAQKIAPLAHGELAALTMASAPLKLPDLAFEDADGKPKKLSDFRGKTLLVNLWATWCVPCRKEMPALDELQGKLSGPNFEVVAINIDTRDLEKPRAWLKEAGITSLGYFSDEKAKIFQDLKLIGKAFGMPTSMLIDKAGCEIGTIAGPAEWASDDAVKLIRAALGK
jgi:thiol-disulfide isomerase/thioredoxin